MIRRIPKPKHIIHKNLELIRSTILAETIMQWRRGQLTNIQLLPHVIAWILVDVSRDYMYKHNFMEYEWKIAYALLSSEKKKKFDKLCGGSGILNHLGMFCYLCGVWPAVYFDKPYIVYCVLLVICIAGSIGAFVTDKLLWHITIGNRISVNRACQLTSVYMPYNVDVLDSRYLLCDGLRSGKISFQSSKALLEIFPGYLYLPDRDGSTSPFQLACQCSSLAVQYMVQLDENLLNDRDDRGNTPLHWACGCGCSTVVRYLLGKEMSLVTETNMDGDLPIHLASEELNRCSNKSRSEIPCMEIVWRLLLAYPDCLSCVGERTSCSNGKYNDDKKNR